MIIAIDGPSGTGKTSVARTVANRLGFHYVDTGAMYRAFAYLCLQNGVTLDNEPGIKRLLGTFNLRIEEGEGKQYFLDDEEITAAIRTPEVSSASSLFSALAPVRQKIIALQQTMGEKGNLVLEGRDIGTVVFPNAEHKFFLTAPPEVRARRRHLELSTKSETPPTEAEVLAAQNKRDHDDTNRALSPLQPATDATIVDTSNMTLDEVVETLLSKI